MIKKLLFRLFNKPRYYYQFSNSAIVFMDAQVGKDYPFDLMVEIKKYSSVRWKIKGTKSL